ncbi:MAG: hypothetical protein R2751_17870 [Bacteroidales bacterium]
MKDLVVLVADKNMGIPDPRFSCVPVEGTREFHYEVHIHLYRDPGIVNSRRTLRPFLDKFHHAMVVLDRTLAGKEK